MLLRALLCMPLAACAATPTSDASLAPAGDRSAPHSERAEETPPPLLDEAPAPWTPRFMQKAVVVADHVRIEGPAGLLDHVVVSSDDVFFEREVRQDGARLVQVTRRISDDVPEIRVQLDQWQFAAFREVTVVEHGAPRGVSVVATGQASFRDPLGAAEHGETLRWDATIGE